MRKKGIFTSANALGTLLMLGILAAILAIGHGLTRADCYFRWSDASMDYRTRLFQCQVKHPKYGWIPADQFRGDN